MQCRLFKAVGVYLLPAVQLKSRKVKRIIFGNMEYILFITLCFLSSVAGDSKLLSQYLSIIKTLVHSHYSYCRCLEEKKVLQTLSSNYAVDFE